MNSTMSSNSSTLSPDDQMVCDECGAVVEHTLQDIKDHVNSHGHDMKGGSKMPFTLKGHTGGIYRVRVCDQCEFMSTGNFTKKGPHKHEIRLALFLVPDKSRPKEWVELPSRQTNSAVPTASTTVQDATQVNQSHSHEPAASTHPSNSSPTVDPVSTVNPVVPMPSSTSSRTHVGDMLQSSLTRDSDRKLAQHLKEIVAVGEPFTPLDDDVVFQYLRHLQKASAHNVLVLLSWRDDLSQELVDAVKSSTGPIYVFFPVRKDRHWYVAVAYYDKTKALFLFLDSSGRRHNDERPSLQNFVSRHFDWTSGHTVQYKDVLGLPVEYDLFESGVYLVAFVDLFLQDPEKAVHTIYDDERISTWQIDTTAYRQKIVHALSNEHQPAVAASMTRHARNTSEFDNELLGLIKKAMNKPSRTAVRDSVQLSLQSEVYKVMATVDILLDVSDDALDKPLLLDAPLEEPEPEPIPKLLPEPVPELLPEPVPECPRDITPSVSGRSLTPPPSPPANTTATQANSTVDSYITVIDDDCEDRLPRGAISRTVTPQPATLTALGKRPSPASPDVGSRAAKRVQQAPAPMAYMGEDNGTRAAAALAGSSSSTAAVAKVNITQPRFQPVDYNAIYKRLDKQRQQRSHLEKDASYFGRSLQGSSASKPSGLRPRKERNPKSTDGDVSRMSPILGSSSEDIWGAVV